VHPHAVDLEKNRLLEGALGEALGLVDSEKKSAKRDADPGEDSKTRAAKGNQRQGA
jgi:hypothetical protein